MHWMALILMMIAQAPPKGAQSDDLESYLMGKADSPVRIELFSDFQCPSCRTFYLYTIASLLKEYSAGNKVACVFREFPLAQHPVARTAARYAVAARSLGRDKWSKVIEHLYFTQGEWSYDGKIEPVLARLLSPEDLRSVTAKLNDPAIDQSLDRDIAMGKSRTVESTPTVFVTAKGKEERVAGGLPFAVMKDYIDRSLR